MSLIVLGYNQERFIDQAIKGALQQDYPNLQILLSDDGSSDRTFEIMTSSAACHRDTHDITAVQTPENLGTLAHVWWAARQSTGDLIVLAAGDDISHPSRVSQTVAAWRQTHAAALFAKYDLIDEAGTIIAHNYKFDDRSIELHSYFKTRKIISIHGASSAYDRRIFTEIIPPDQRILFEDNFFSLILNQKSEGIVFIDQPLVQYRKHADSITNSTYSSPSRTDMDMQEKKGCVYATSILNILDYFDKTHGEDTEIDIRRVRQDAHFFEYRSRWLEYNLIQRMTAIATIRRWSHLRWASPRLFGVEGLLVLKSLQWLFRRPHPYDETSL